MKKSGGMLLLAVCVACNGDKDGGKTGETGEPLEQWAILGDSANLPAAALLSIWGTSTDMFIVGADDGTGPVVLHWDGSAWERLETFTTGDLWWVWSDGGDVVFMSGEGGRMLQYSKSARTFTEEVITNPAYKLFGIWGSSATDVFAVGGDINGANDGIVLHYDGTTWAESHIVSDNPGQDGTPGTPDDSPRQAFKVWGSAADDVWVVGTGALVSHFDGAAWTDLPQPVYQSSPLTTVSGSGPSDIWAVGGFGNAIVAHFDGTAWADASPPPQDIVPFFNGVSASAAYGVAACGGNGSIYYRQGTVWQADERARPTVRDFHACLWDEVGDLWAVGGDLVNLSEGVIVYGGESVTLVAL